ncbi:threonine/serine exporter family protein [Paenibacillus yanchengensis]|uniref:Threonine/serine exporter family protein n=1 Tax=Paenibacillus yanchengensis TaxID=2035833 RepID=A0ABW4YQI0_9BACL
MSHTEITNDAAVIDNVQSDSQFITRLCLLAGKIIMESGGETQRVEDTMMRIAAAYGHTHSHSYVTPTGILFAIDGSTHATRLVRISERNNNLTKVALVNDVSRQIAAGKLHADQAYEKMQSIDLERSEYPNWLTTLAAAIASGSFLFLVGGTWTDLLPILMIGGSGFYCFIWLHSYIKIKFFAEFVAALLIGTLAIVTTDYGLATNLDTIIIGSVIPLVPGLNITNAVRDLMAGHLVSGLSKGAESLLTATAIGAGIAAILTLYS